MRVAPANIQYHQQLAFMSFGFVFEISFLASLLCKALRGNIPENYRFFPFFPSI